ncbi:low affinity immunoglobulin epsilon Fc receptor-like [Hemicordylus capensis]|uniref:low affinity immunoglobulin epsilon Fc receptor-like n=1 Tax=Hemicordylus capensis TaxID=884348 RepID=UPI0023025107|nr:low affinity immunoglobulin epsilon Fc receptor-like [Hemicordylus capensis]
MASGGIYKNCEEPEPRENLMGMAPKRAGGFLLQHCRCGSDARSIPVLFIVNAVMFVLWIIVFSIVMSKYSEMAKELEELRGNQNGLKVNGSNTMGQLEKLHASQSTYETVMNNSLKSLKEEQTEIKAEMTKRLNGAEDERKSIQKETFKLQKALQKINDSNCQVCPGGWLLNNGQCYMFQKQSVAWSHAMNWCKDRGSQLVVINDDMEQAFLRSQTNQLSFWIGLSDMKAENTFVWVDGSSLTYKKWAPQEPNDAGHGEDCVVIAGRGWNDRECGGTSDGWICEKPWNC